jgi:hypothetical protein
VALGAACALAAAALIAQPGTGSITAAPVASWTFTPSTTKVLHNPGMGGVITFDDNESYTADTFFQDPNVSKILDSATSPGTPSILYIRTTWAQLEPTRGSYTWNFPNSRISKLLQRAQDHHLKVSLQVRTDSTNRTANGGQATPPWVFAAAPSGAGAQPGTIYTVPGTTTEYTNPRVDDDNFLAAYGNFIKALGEEFNKPDLVAYVDGVGMGVDGNLQTLNQPSSSFDVNKAWNSVTTAYKDAFDRVPLTLDYVSDGAVPKSSLDTAINSGRYLPRIRSLGISKPSFLKEVNTKWPASATVTESAFSSYHTGGPWSSYYGSVNTTLKRVAMGATSLHANTLNFGTPESINAWLNNPPITPTYNGAGAYVKWFVQNGGYRLYPSSVIKPGSTARGSALSIYATWKNDGTGVLTNLPANPDQASGPLNKKYRVAYRLLDSDNRPVANTVTINKSADPGTWVNAQDNPVDPTTLIIPSGLSVGSTYKLAAAIVDTTNVDATTKEAQPAIQLALSGDSYKDGQKVTAPDGAGWYPIGTITIS